ncbi:MAG: hypothetical protein K6G88_02990, partial [Lachnospiraceae bacterium]|nr:hypothetical protein [Lachnospiraceae bacterium]
MEKDWLFPYLEIEKGSKIVIYGAGKIGEAYYKQCIYTEYCDVVLWCDSKFESINTNVGVVESPEKIRDVDFDKVIIAVATKGNCIGIFDKLSEMHVPYQKIWSPYDDLSMEINKKALEFPLRQGQGTLDKEHLDIAVIAGRPIQGSGGVRNIYRMVSYLRDFGHHITVYYID